MESQDLSPPHVDASRPSLGFPLGTALLLIIIFSLSGIFSCCYHWEKLRSFRRNFADGTDPDADIEASSSKSKPEYTVNFPSTWEFNPFVFYTGHLNLVYCCNQDLKKNQSQSVPVLMPGDQIPKFIALPCPCEPPRPDKVEVKVEKAPPKPPRFPVPLY